MQATVPPWAWVTWDRRARSRAGEYARARDRLAPRARDHDKFAFYGLRKNSGHFIRLDHLSKSLLLNRQWATSAPVTWRVDRFHHDADPWRVPDIKSIESYRPYEAVSLAAPPASGRPAGAPHAWGHAARGWAAGAVLLALLVLVVRAAENCLHKKLFKAIYMHTNVGAGEYQCEMMSGQYHLNGVRRHESDEWSTPTVTATSLRNHNMDMGLPTMDDSDIFIEPGLHSNDLPPPYSECTRSNNVNKYISEEPPPPYSACYVSYTHPKDGMPAVHINTRRRQNILEERAHSSTEIDNVQNDLIESGGG